MNDKAWGKRTGSDPFASSSDDDGYKAWRTSSQTSVRDLKFVPASSSDDLTRFVSLLQTISIELNKAETRLCMMCHTSGQCIFIKGHGLGELADLISTKRVQSAHVFDEKTDGVAPEQVVTSVRFDKSITELMPPE